MQMCKLCKCPKNAHAENCPLVADPTEMADNDNLRPEDFTPRDDDDDDEDEDPGEEEAE